jgi:hypothetical protein
MYQLRFPVYSQNRAFSLKITGGGSRVEHGLCSKRTVQFRAELEITGEFKPLLMRLVPLRHVTVLLRFPDCLLNWCFIAWDKVPPNTCFDNLLFSLQHWQE